MSTEKTQSGIERHLRRLVSVSPLLADLSQADLLIMLPEGDGFRVMSHVRPMNARTVYPIDQTGLTFAMSGRPLADRAFKTGEIFDGGLWLERRSRWIRTLAVPIRFDGRIIGVLAREFSPSIEVLPGDLELISFATFRRFASMIAAGSYPFRVETRRHDHPPRVGDGIMLFDRAGRLEYASPNAISVLRHIGSNLMNRGQRFGDSGIDAPGFRQAYLNGLEYTDEIDLGNGTLSTWCLPMLAGQVVTGALVLVRNITELRQRDRLLLTKDATIAEIHHRVKNSLQTASSLLQLQSRRVDSTDARVALAESARRIRSIGVVHELLSHRTDDEVQFGEILSSLTAMIRDSLIDPGRPVRIEIDADDAILPSKLTTPLALVASELVQNSIDHATGTVVHVTSRVEPDAVTVDISDDGAGFGPDFSIEQSAGLGLTIVRTMVESELSGSLSISSSPALGGAAVSVRVPLFEQTRQRMESLRATIGE